ncbi:hypothetical protein ACH5RR_031637 [Cinchona calisaya]|uniref:Uncharacterized protein n=1 Tax=Cinchona calisaya TaxID=153742 RepID=A0ABD2YFT8_9GENT
MVSWVAEGGGVVGGMGVFGDGVMVKLELEFRLFEGRNNQGNWLDEEADDEDPRWTFKSSFGKEPVFFSLFWGEKDGIFEEFFGFWTNGGMDCQVMKLICRDMGKMEILGNGFAEQQR